MPLKQGQDLRQLVGYQLQRASLIAEQDARRALEPFGLSPAKMTALLLIRDNPGCDQTALGHALGINRSSAMRQVNILEERGLIERRPGRDARTNALHLTASGEEQMAAVLAAINAADRALVETLTGEEAALLGAMLERIARPSPRPRPRRALPDA